MVDFISLLYLTLMLLLQRLLVMISLLKRDAQCLHRFLQRPACTLNEVLQVLFRFIEGANINSIIESTVIDAFA